MPNPNQVSVVEAIDQVRVLMAELLDVMKQALEELKKIKK